MCIWRANPISNSKNCDWSDEIEISFELLKPATWKKSLARVNKINAKR